jgi:hypothetical protein
VVRQPTVGLRGQLFQFRQGNSVADAGDDVLTLGIGQVVAVEAGPPGGRVAGEGDSAAGVGAQVAVHHALHRDGRAQVVVMCADCRVAVMTKVA